MQKVEVSDFHKLSLRKALVGLITSHWVSVPYMFHIRYDYFTIYDYLKIYWSTQTPGNLIELNYSDQHFQLSLGSSALPTTR